MYKTEGIQKIIDENGLISLIFEGFHQPE